MAFVTLNGLTATRLTLRLPVTGAWTAEAEVATTDVSEVTGTVRLAFAGSELVGVSRNPGTDAGGRTTVRVLAGAGGLDSPVEALGYTQTIAQIVLTALLQKGGETLSLSSDAASLAYQLPHWIRSRGDVASALRRLTEAIGATWRHTLAGEVWVGTDTWPEVDPEHQVLQESPTDNSDVVAIESLGILPGKTFRGKRVAGVEYTVDEKSCRARVSYGEARDGLAAEVGLWVRRETAQFDYFGSYDVRVAKQNDNGTLELIPDSSRIPGLSNVPIRGLPGCKVKVSPGARATLRFLDGSPAKPYVADFEPSSLVELQLGEGASHHLASGDAALAWVLAILAAPCASPGSPLVVTPPFLYPSPTSIRSDGPART